MFSSCCSVKGSKVILLVTYTIGVVKCFLPIDNFIPIKKIEVYPNQETWMNKETQSVLMLRSKTFKKDDPLHYKKAKFDLSNRIGENSKTSWRFNSFNQMPGDWLT